MPQTKKRKKKGVRSFQTATKMKEEEEEERRKNDRS